MQTLVKTYRGSQTTATNQFRRDAVRMAAQGLVPTTQTWAAGSYGFGSFVVAFLLCFILIGFLIFVYMLIVKPAGTLTVTYAAVAAGPSTADEKTCPKCAEDVKRAAVVCRFCGHSFPEPEPARISPAPLHEATPAQRSLAFEFGAWFGSMWPHNWFKIAVIAFPLLAFARLQTLDEPRVPDATAAASQAQPAASSPDSDVAEQEKCRANRGGQVASYRSLLKAGKAWEAANEVRTCSNALNDPELKKFVADAEILSYKQTIGAPKASKADRLQAMQALMRNYPEAGKPYEAKIASLGLQVAKEEAAADAARRRKQGVTIGMTEDEVRQSSWGRPQSVNRTVMANGTHEQWVYSGGYLYFEDGVLTSIQD